MSCRSTESGTRSPATSLRARASPKLPLTTGLQSCSEKQRVLECAAAARANCPLRLIQLPLFPLYCTLFALAHTHKSRINFSTLIAASRLFPLATARRFFSIGTMFSHSTTYLANRLCGGSSRKLIAGWWCVHNVAGMRASAYMPVVCYSCEAQEQTKCAL
jgi:hypothetical protein